MIPKITHHRCNLWANFTQFEDTGAHVLSISEDIYPELFAQRFPSLMAKAKDNKFLHKPGKKTKYLYFYAGALTASDCGAIKQWCTNFKQYRLIGPGRLTCFDGELDFCLSLDFNFTCEKTLIRTKLGAIVHNLKYEPCNCKKTDFGELVNAMKVGIAHLPIEGIPSNKIILTNIPGETKDKIPYQLVKTLSSVVEYQCELCLIKKGTKPEIKKLPFKEKILAYEKFYASIQITDAAISGKTIVVIDDLYQSGITMWSYAKCLKKLGAKYVLGITCVKTMRDDDNL